MEEGSRVATQKKRGGGDEGGAKTEGRRTGILRPHDALQKRLQVPHTTDPLGLLPPQPFDFLLELSDAPRDSGSTLARAQRVGVPRVPNGRYEGPGHLNVIRLLSSGGQATIALRKITLDAGRLVSARRRGGKKVGSRRGGRFKGVVCRMGEWRSRKSLDEWGGSWGSSGRWEGGGGEGVRDGARREEGDQLGGEKGGEKFVGGHGGREVLGHWVEARGSLGVSGVSLDHRGG